MTAHGRATRHGARARGGPLLWIWLATGCSLIGVRGPPPASADGRPPDCTTSRVAPALDVSAGAPLLALGLIGALNATTCTHDPNTYFDLCPTDKGAATRNSMLVAAAGGVLLYSAIHGFRATGACRAARACAAGDAAGCVAAGDPKGVPAGGADPSDGIPVQLTVCVSDLDCAEVGGVCHQGRCRDLSR